MNVENQKKKKKKNKFKNKNKTTNKKIMLPHLLIVDWVDVDELARARGEQRVYELLFLRDELDEQHASHKTAQATANWKLTRSTNNIHTHTKKLFLTNVGELSNKFESNSNSTKESAKLPLPGFIKVELKRKWEWEFLFSPYLITNQKKKRTTQLESNIDLLLEAPLFFEYPMDGAQRLTVFDDFAGVHRAPRKCSDRWACDRALPPKWRRAVRATISTAVLAWEWRAAASRRQRWAGTLLRSTASTCGWIRRGLRCRWATHRQARSNEPCAQQVADLKQSRQSTEAGLRRHSQQTTRTLHWEHFQRGRKKSLIIIVRGMHACIKQ